MKVQNSRSETIPLAKVAELAEVAAILAATTPEEILASMPEIKKCWDCTKLDAKLDASGRCPKCAKDYGNPPTPAIDENQAEADAQLNKDASWVVTPPRPSLEVETEVHANLAPRIEAHLSRMRAWDTRKLDSDYRVGLVDAIADVGEAFKRLGEELINLGAIGFVAKTTPVTRLASKLATGAKVSLRDDQRAVFAKVYSDEQLGSLSVVQVTDTHVQLMAEDGSNLGLVKIIHVQVKP